MRISNINCLTKHTQYKSTRPNHRMDSLAFKNKQGAFLGAGIGFMAGISSIMPCIQLQGVKPDFFYTALVLFATVMGSYLGDKASDENDNNRNLR